MDRDFSSSQAGTGGKVVRRSMATDTAVCTEANSEFDEKHSCGIKAKKATRPGCQLTKCALSGHTGRLQWSPHPASPLSAIASAEGTQQKRHTARRLDQC